MSSLMFCHHTRNSFLLLAMQRLTERFFAAREEQVNSLDRCDECNTAYQLELRAIRSNELAVVITRWIDLGSDIEPVDPRWTVHAKWIPPGYCASSNPSDVDHNPRSVFEEAFGGRNSSDYFT